MSAYPVPLEQLPTFNSGDFITNTSTLTLSLANSLFAQLAGSNIMSGLNTFSNAISVMGVNISSNVSSALTNINIGSTSNSSGQYNICTGQGSGAGLTTGQYNIATGFNSMSSVTTGSNNYILGYNSGINLAAGSNGNVNIGQASSGLGTCINCTAIGYNSMANNTNSVAIGSGTISSNLNSTAIGCGSSTSHDNSTAIGSGAITTSANQIMLGTTNETTQITGLLNVVGNATLTLPIFTSQPLMSYTVFTGNVSKKQGHATTSTTSISATTGVSTIKNYASVSASSPGIGSYMVEGSISFTSPAINSSVELWLNNVSVTQNTAYTQNFMTNGVIVPTDWRCRVVGQFNVISTSTIIYLSGISLTDLTIGAVSLRFVRL